MGETVQDTLIADLLESSDDNEMVQLLEFLKKNGVPLTKDQVMASFMLEEYGLPDIALYAQTMRTQMTPTSHYYKGIDKTMLGDRVTGKVKMSQLFKGGVNPAMAQGIPMGIEKGVK